MAITVHLVHARDAGYVTVYWCEPLKAALQLHGSYIVPIGSPLSSERITAIMRAIRARYSYKISGEDRIVFELSLDVDDSPIIGPASPTNGALETTGASRRKDDPGQYYFVSYLEYDSGCRSFVERNIVLHDIHPTHWLKVSASGRPKVVRFYEKLDQRAAATVLEDNYIEVWRYSKRGKSVPIS